VQYLLPSLAVTQAALMISLGGEEKLEAVANSEAQLRHFKVFQDN
jgi:hypothetical protein